MEKAWKILRFLPLLILLCLLAVYAPQIKILTPSEIAGLVPAAPRLAALIILSLFLIKSVAPLVPAIVLYMSAGLLFPAGPALVICFLGMAADMSVGYFLGRCLGSDRVWKLAERNEKARHILETGKRDGFMTCFFVRFLPAPPPEIINILIGSAGMINYRPYIVATMLGNLPFMVSCVLAGTSAGEPLSPAFLIPFCLGLCFSLFSLFAYRFMVKSHKDD